MAFHSIVFEVNVSNIGTVYRGPSLQDARAEFDGYVRASQRGLGRAGHESVVLFQDDELIAEHVGSQEQES